LRQTVQAAVVGTNPHEAGRAIGRGENCRDICGIGVGLAIALLLLTSGGTIGRAQMQGSNPGSNGGQGSSQNSGRGGGFGRSSTAPFSSDDDYDPVMTGRRVSALNTERQKQMVADANKLLKLARELNDEVAAANERAFTPDQLRKIAEIEKLAKNVRERMTAGIGQAPSTMSPPNLVYPVH
jgi:hypothetical protein